MGLITITFEAGQSVGTIDTTSSLESTLLTIGYPVLAASISPELRTDSWGILVAAEGGGTKTISFARSLPASAGEIAALANAGIDAAYPLSLNPLPGWIKRTDGYYLTNLTTGDVTFTFGANSRVLWVGGMATPTIPAGGSLGPFHISPTLGAVSQNIAFQDGEVLTLPISAAYGESLLVHLPTDTHWPNTHGTTATLSVRYPAVNTKTIVTPPRPFEIVASITLL